LSWTNVVKMNMMHPFCVKHHVNICRDTSITSIKINAWNIFITFGLPPFCKVKKTDLIATWLATGNKFDCSNF
jgi:hypothetical protein